MKDRDEHLKELQDEDRGKKPEKEVDKVTKAMEELTKAVVERYQASNTIKREGSQIVIPSFMNLIDVAQTLMDWEKNMETETAKQIKIFGHQDDVLSAFYHGIKNAFGNLSGERSIMQSMFGSFAIPALSKTIRISHDENMTVPYGEISIPGVPIRINIHLLSEKQPIKNPLDECLMINATYKKKYEPIVEMIEREVKTWHLTHSIFRGKAMDSRFKFINLQGFPLDRIVYTDIEEKSLSANIFRIIESSKSVADVGIALKRTILLYGGYGTGKTLTALRAANICVNNGWTFINVVPTDPIEPSIEVAKKYQPCLVFFEDIDSVTDNKQNINSILNTIDGLLSKSSQIMIILTTNSITKIEKAMLRPGRIDAVIEMGKIDVKSLGGLVKAYCGKSLNGDINYTDLLASAQGYTPSFVSEACQRAVLFALDRVSGTSPDISITQDDLKMSLLALRAQFDLMMQPKSEKNEFKDALVDVVREAIKTNEKLVVEECGSSVVKKCTAE